VDASILEQIEGFRMLSPGARVCGGMVVCSKVLVCSGSKCRAIETNSVIVLFVWSFCVCVHELETKTVLLFLLSVCVTSVKGHMVDALASRADEGRTSLR
jgi:hypothetical protein